MIQEISLDVRTTFKGDLRYGLYRGRDIVNFSILHIDFELVASLMSPQTHHCFMK